MARGRKTTTAEMTEATEMAQQPEVCFCPTDAQTEMMKVILAASAVEPFYCFVPNNDDLDALVMSGMVEVNEEVRDPEDENRIAARATEKGKAFMHTPPEVVKKPTPISDFAAMTGETLETTEEQQPLKSAANFVIADMVPLPETNGKRKGKASVYPFAKLEIGQSFFIPGQDAATKHAPTVNSANARYAVDDPSGALSEHRMFLKDEAGEYVLDEAGKRKYQVYQAPAKILTREFKIFPVEDGAPWGHAGVSGAGVWRIR